MAFLLLIGGIFFCAAGFYRTSQLQKYESENRNARGVLQFTYYHGQRSHENNKVKASLFRIAGLLLLLAALILFIAPLLKQG